jgi:hypothetical protein
MRKLFYSELLNFDSLITELQGLDISNEEREHLILLVNSNLHTTIVDAILEELNDEDKEKFLSHLMTNDNEKIWELLNVKTVQIEDKIKRAAEELKKELHDDIENIKT